MVMTLTKTSSTDLVKKKFHLPDAPEEYLDIVIIDNEEEQIEDFKEVYPLAVSDVTSEIILDAERLSEGEDVKEIYSLELSNKFHSFKPGDTIGIVTKNREEDVKEFFNRLGIKNLARKKCKIIEKCTVQKKILAKSSFIGKTTTLEYIFTYCLDIQSLPKKQLIRILADHTKDEKEKTELEELCSKEGGDLYTKKILETNRSFLDLLLMYPNCYIPVARLIENLPKLTPRPYSLASSPLAMPDRIRIVFSVIKCGDGITREGLCTGMLKNMILSKEEKENRVNLFFRKCNGFNLPEDNVPLILLGPGTGIAPFIGFLAHRKAQQIKGKIWLFFGCRYKNKDYIFRKELEEYLDCDILTKLLVAFSRDSDSEVKYVQDNLKKHGKEVCDLIFEENGLVYVCGDAKNMRKDVQNAFVEIFQTHKGLTNKEALDYMKKLQKEKRYLQDIWF